MKADLYKPGPQLSQYIDNYMLVDIDWKEEATNVFSVWRLIPFGQVSMLFLYGDAHGYNLEGPQYRMFQTQKAFIVGQLTRPIWLKFSGHTRLLKVQFKSAGLQQFLPFNMEELTNVPSFDLGTIWGTSVDNLLEQLFEAPTDLAIINTIEAFFQARLQPSTGLIDYVDYTIDQLKASTGNLSISKIETRLGISRRHLERLFKTKVGLSPKELSRIIRLNYALGRLKSKSCSSLSGLSFDAGYYDQSHFSRDFKGITGVSPSRLLKESTSELFVTNGKCFSEL